MDQGGLEFAMRGFLQDETVACRVVQQAVSTLINWQSELIRWTIQIFEDMISVKTLKDGTELTALPETVSRILVNVRRGWLPGSVGKELADLRYPQQVEFSTTPIL
ncbi:hypothetical protein FRC04_007880 [Tulasnella sp. 424]|nr:hypothetical protein FRC04_007880 [Tulasnella sp. 424]KAG8975063.1 hypothetical protein FRC05_006486 [Tulasnella sp. 425]